MTSPLSASPVDLSTAQHAYRPYLPYALLDSFLTSPCLGFIHLTTLWLRSLLGARLQKASDLKR